MTTTSFAHWYSRQQSPKHLPVHPAHGWSWLKWEWSKEMGGGVFYDPNHSPGNHFNHSSNSAWYWLTTPLSHPFPTPTSAPRYKEDMTLWLLLPEIAGNLSQPHPCPTSPWVKVPSSLCWNTQLTSWGRAVFISGYPGVTLDVGSMSREADLC